MSSSHRSLWQDKVGVKGVVRELPTPSNLGDGEILVHAQAWGLNPADHILQDVPLDFVTYPLILGEDVAGTVELVGSGASSRFRKGDRVCGCALGGISMRPEEGCFQDYVVLDQTLAMKIPNSMSITDAAIFPCGVCTAGRGLFSKSFLGLPYPQLRPSSSGKCVFVWGGSSVVGSNAIQLCRFAGFEVITTCSTHNFDYVKSLGASTALDYSSPSVIDDIVAELDKGICAGIYHAAGPVKPSCEVAAKSKQKLFVASVAPVMPDDAPDGVEAKMLYTEGRNNIYAETFLATFGGFLPEALASGVYKTAPSAEIVRTKGFEGIEEGLNILRKGVSAKKIVVENK
ncbi:MAG: hypothetical protein M1828_003253 [Chrysothrix sp. TS-e1954]|nr:MAG: hypothetical protein M1828_003253 [Chrysothrix sp. TS-e1954]